MLIEHFHYCPVFSSSWVRNTKHSRKKWSLTSTFDRVHVCVPGGGGLKQKRKILINQAVRVKIDHLDNNVLGSRVPGQVLLAFSCRGREGAAYWFRCRWTHLSEISIATYLMTVHLSASIGELSCLFMCGCTCSNASPCLFMVSTPPCWREEHIALRWSSVRPEGWMSASSAVQ